MNRRTLLRLAAVAGLVPITSSLSNAAPTHDDEYPIASADVKLVPARYRRQVVSYGGDEKAGTIVVDTANKFLFLVQPGGTALRYGIGVGRQGFSWSGRAEVRWKAKWPRWTPPAEMVTRDPLAAKWADGMPGGPGNPLGARALYLFQGNVDTLYRIHGTFDPKSIGKAVSSGCIRLLNFDVVDLYDRVKPGSQVIVLQSGARGLRSAKVEKPKREEGSSPRSSRQEPVVRKNFNLDLGEYRN